MVGSLRLSLLPRGACVALALGVACAAAPASATRIAVLPLRGDVSDAERARLDEGLREALAERSGVTLQPARETAEALVATEALEGPCDVAAPECMARVGRVAVVDLVIGGSASGAGSSVRVSLSLVSPRGAVVRTAAVDVPADSGAEALRRLAIRLVEPSADGAFLEVITERGAVIFIDGKNEGTAPHAPFLKPPGKHRVEVVAPGHETAEREVQLRYGVTVRLEVPLTPQRAERPPHDDPEPEEVRVPARTSDSAPEIKIAVLGLENRDDDARVVAWLTDAVVVEARKRERVTVIDRATAMRSFGDVGADWGKRVDACGGVALCLTNIAAELGVDLVITGHVERNALGREVFLTGTSFRDGVTGYFTKHALRGRRARELAQIVGPSVAELLPDYGLRQGERAGASAVQRYWLDPPPVPAVVFLGTAGLSAVSALAAGGLGAVFFSGTVKPPADVSIGVLALSATGAAVGAGAIAAVMAPFTDWGPPEE